MLKTVRTLGCQSNHKGWPPRPGELPIRPTAIRVRINHQPWMCIFLLSWDIQHLILLAALTSRNIIFATRQFTTTHNTFGNEISRYTLRTLRYALAWHWNPLASFGHFSISSSSSQLCHRHPLFAKSSREICFARRVAAHLRFDARVSLAKTMSTQCF